MEEQPRSPEGAISKYHEFIMYVIFGVSTTIVSWLVFSVCEVWFGLDVVWSNVIANAIAVIVAYVTNKLFVFKSKSWEIKLVTKEASVFVGGRLLTIVLDIAAVPWLVSIGLDQTLFGVPNLLAKITSTVSISLLNYTVSKFIAFRPGQKKTLRQEARRAAEKDRDAEDE